MGCDLHMHSTHSDGSLDVQTLVREVGEAGVEAFSLTDHDTVAGLPEARELARDLGLRMLDGIEISTQVDGLAVHVLGYGFDPAHAELRTMLRALGDARHSRIPLIVERLTELGAPITTDAVMAIAAGGSPGRPHVARALVEAGHCESIQDAFTHFLGDGKPAHIEKRMPTPSEAIRVLQSAGGRAVWAHPLARPIQRTGGVDQLAREMKRAGLSGLEVVHPSQSPVQRKRLRQLCRELSLLETGGSDYHGAHSPGIRPGVGRGHDEVPTAVFDALV